MIPSPLKDKIKKMYYHSSIIYAENHHNLHVLHMFAVLMQNECPMAYWIYVHNSDCLLGQFSSPFWRISVSIVLNTPASFKSFIDKKVGMKIKTH